MSVECRLRYWRYYNLLTCMHTLAKPHGSAKPVARSNDGTASPAIRPEAIFVFRRLRSHGSDPHRRNRTVLRGESSTLFSHHRRDPLGCIWRHEFGSAGDRPKRWSRTFGASE